MAGAAAMACAMATVVVLAGLQIADLRFWRGRVVGAQLVTQADGSRQIAVFRARWGTVTIEWREVE